MKSKNFSCSLIIISTVICVSLFTGCQKVEMQNNNQSDNRIEENMQGYLADSQSKESETATVVADFASDGKPIDVTIKVNSVTVMDEVITGLNNQPFQYLPDIYAVSEDGKILCDYSFVAVNLTIESETEVNACVAGIRLLGDNYGLIGECFYNDSPIDDNLKNSGFALIKANTENTVNIGFFVDEDAFSNSEFYLELSLIDTGEKTNNYINLSSIQER